MENNNIKINFERIEIFQDVAHTQCTVQNVKTDFANILYNYGHGIQCHALALKIYNSKGDEEYTEEECQLIKQYSEMCNPAFIEAISTILNKQDKE